MAQLIVRKLDAKLVDRLKRRAKEHGVSTEEEHRRILKEILEVGSRKKPKKSFLDLLCEVPDFGKNADAYRKDVKWREIDLD